MAVGGTLMTIDGRGTAVALLKERNKVRYNSESTKFSSQGQVLTGLRAEMRSQSKNQLSRTKASPQPPAPSYLMMW